MDQPYTKSLTEPVRRESRVVEVGDVRIGGHNPIVVQSMTTPSTLDTKATVDQIERLVDVGCEIVRVTTPAMADAENLPNIRAEMKRRRINVPLVADVHFLPQIALKACQYVEKVRINPGNFADRKRFDVKEYTDDEYDEELERIREAFLPVVKRARELGVALRIGTNHGSLSDRIMNRYGDTPLGMVESALEFVRIAEEEDFKNIVLSMKASNTQVMIQAYRLLVAEMDKEWMDYPLHLGVTEAGDGEDGRIKSAIGIGSLLSDGLGDTVRVSLTEDPEAEIPVAQTIVRHYGRRFSKIPPIEKIRPSWDFYSYNRRSSTPVSIGAHTVGGKDIVGVRTDVAAMGKEQLDPGPDCLVGDGVSGQEKTAPLVIRLRGITVGDLPGIGKRFDAISIRPEPAWRQTTCLQDLIDNVPDKPVWFCVEKPDDLERAILWLEASRGHFKTGVEIEGISIVSLGRRAAARFTEAGLRPPIHLHYRSRKGEKPEDATIRAATEIGSLLCDGIGDSVEVTTSHGAVFDHRLAFSILQGSRVRMSRTEYIACPSCGRTLFDLQETTARIRERTNHLKGVKIAIMGCIVNGPGEMADADFGYVGSGPGFINLFVGKECVERGIPQAEAVERLIKLIKEHGRWNDPT